MLQSALFFNQRKIVYPLVFNCKIFRHGKYSYHVRKAGGKPNLNSNLQAHVQYKSQHIQHNSTIKRFLFVIKEKIKVISYVTYTTHVLLIIYPYTRS